MATIDGLAISSGSNRGEAAFLGESNFDPTELAWRVGQQARKDKELRRAEAADNMALLNDKIKTQWDSDTYNYFQPKVTALKSTIMDAMKDSNGKLTPLQKMQFKGAWDELKSEADVNNKLFESYQNQVKQLEEDPQGEKWDRNISTQNLQRFRDPYSVPELKADIQQNYGGNVNKWRTANYAKFGLEPSFSFEEYIGDVTKDEKPQEYTVKNEKGEIVYGKHPTGERYTTVGKKFSPEQVQSITNRVWNESNYKSERAKQNAKSYVDGVFSLGEDGTISFSSNLTDAEKNVAKKAIQYAGDLKGLKAEEIKNKLAKGYLSAVVDIKGDLGQETKDIGFAPVSNKSGSGGFSDKWTTAVVPATSVATDVTAFNKRYGTSYTAEEFNSNKVNPKAVGYIAIEPKSKSADTESIQLNINGKQIRPIGYKLQDGKVYMTISEQVGVPDAFGQMKYTAQVKTDVPLQGEAMGNVVAHYGFEREQQFKDFLKKKQNELGLPSESVQIGKKATPKTSGGIDLSQFDKTKK